GGAPRAAAGEGELVGPALGVRHRVAPLAGTEVEDRELGVASGSRNPILVAPHARAGRLFDPARGRRPGEPAAGRSARRRGGHRARCAARGQGRMPGRERGGGLDRGMAGEQRSGRRRARTLGRRAHGGGSLTAAAGGEPQESEEDDRRAFRERHCHGQSLASTLSAIFFAASKAIAPSPICAVIRSCLSPLRTWSCWRLPPAQNAPSPSPGTGRTSPRTIGESALCVASSVEAAASALGWTRTTSERIRGWLVLPAL